MPTAFHEGLRNMLGWSAHGPGYRGQEVHTLRNCLNRRQVAVGE